MKKLVKLFILLSILLISALLFCSCGKTVPVYQGMSISSSSKSLHTPGYAIPLSSSDIKNEEGAGEESDVPPLDEDDALEGVTEEVSESYLEVLGSTKEIYYATPGEDIYIHIHINNPDNFEILSFTLNGSVYSSYMFEDGSDMETLILKYNVGMESGIKEYTIDAIKYVDGTEIKDVRMDGEKTVRAAIKAENQITASLDSVTKGKDSLKLKITLSDNDGLVEFSNGIMKVLLYDETGENLIGSQDIASGENEVLFSGLSSNTDYQYVIGGFYDDLSGEGLKIHMLTNGVLTTDYVILFDAVQPSENGVSFEILFNEIISDKVLSSLKLYSASGELVSELEASERSITGLFSDTKYTLFAEYTDSNISESVTFEFATKAIPEPIFEISEPTLTESSINANLSVTDMGTVLTDYKIELYLAESFVAENEDKKISFEGLESYSEYTVRITYTFDLKNGLGAITKISEKKIKTPPSIAFTSLSVLNDGFVSYGETLYLRIGLNNPSGLVPISVEINGFSYDVAPSSSSSSILLEVICDDKFGARETEIKAERIKAAKDGEFFNITPDFALCDTVYVNGKIDVEEASLVNANYENISWAFPSDNVFLLITIDNPTGYKVDKVTISGTEHESVQMLDEQRCLIPISLQGGSNTFDLTRIVYSNEYVSKELDLPALTCRCFEVVSDEAKLVSSAADLLDLKDGYYYELTDNIDLSGLMWEGVSLVGVFNGNGHTVSNMSVELSKKGEHVYAGLFSSVAGVVQNLGIKNSKINVFLNSTSARFNLYAGLVTAYVECGVIINCNADSTCSVYGENVGIGTAFVGGIAGYSDSNSKIEKAINYAPVTSTSAAGGIVGYGTYIYSCDNHASVTAQTGVGGIVSAGNHIYNCKNFGKISGTGAAIGGILGNGEYIFGCENRGEIYLIDASEGKSIGGIAGYGSEIYDCKNFGKISFGVGSVANSIGGIVGEGGSIYDCLNEGEIKDADKKSSDIGGIVGHATASVYNSKNAADISGARNVGGIAGKCEFDVRGCENSGKITGNSYIGGIIGHLSSAKVTACKNSGSVSGDSYISGICGIASTFSSISACENLGEISGTSMQIGGIAGEASLSDIAECKNLGKISGTIQVGGITGFNNGTLKDCENRGEVTADSDVGGIAGYNFNKILSSVNYGKIEGKMSVGGIAGYISDISDITDCENFGETTSEEVIEQ